MSDFGGTAHEEGLRVLVEDLASPEAGLTPRGNYFQRSRGEERAGRRLLTQAQFTAHPEHADVPIERPIFVMGLPRTGTTALHRLLHADPRHQGLEMWLTQYPQPRPPRETWEDDPIFNAMQQAFTAHHVESPEFMGIHYMDATSVEECWRLLRQTGKSNSYESLANLPRYSQWLQGQDWTDAYARHKQNLQLIGLNDPDKRWVLKNPSHMTALDALMTVYPDALIVYTHRDPVTCIASSCSLSAETTAGHSTTYVGGVIGQHPARPVVARLPRVPRRAAGVRPGAVRRRRVQGPARRPDRRDPRDLRAVGLDWTPEVAGRDRGDRPRVQVRRTRRPSTTTRSRTTGSPSDQVRAAFDRWTFEKKRVVIWGTGVVGKLVIAEIVKHPAFELVGVGVSNPDKVGRDAADLCGLAEPTGVLATDSVDELVALRPDALVALRPDRAVRRREHPGDVGVPARRHRRLLDRDDAVGVADDDADAGRWVDPITAACEAGRRVVLHDRHRPRASPTTSSR